MSFTATPSPHGVQLALQQARTNNTGGHVAVSACLLHSEAADELLEMINLGLSRYQSAITAYDAEANTGFLKRCIVREGLSSQSAQQPVPPDEPETVHTSSSQSSFVVNWVTNGEGNRQERAALSDLSRELLRSPSGRVTGAVQSLHTERRSGAPVDSTRVLCGEPFIFASVLGVLYRISPNAFFQVSHQQCEVLFSQVLAMANVQAEDVVLDLYCGSGALALQFSALCTKVVGVEVVVEAIEDARVNAELNGFTNASFHVANLSSRSARDRKVLRKLSSAHASVIVVDPGRSGLSEHVRGFVRDDTHARRMVYVSCNSETMCRDIKAICADGRWRCEKVVGVDMFPQTDHLETIAVLGRVSK